MTKNAKKNDSNQELCIVAHGDALWLPESVQRNLFAFVVQEGMKALGELLEGDREALCGPPHRKGPAGAPVRWGYADGRLTMGGQRVIVRRPRVRQEDQEVTLPSWEEFADTDPLDERTMEQMVLGVSTRGYKRSVEGLPEELEPHAASKSSASRRFVATTQRKLDAWLERDLSELQIVAIMVDGIVIDEHSVLIALGIDEDGVKHPLGLWAGATENSTVCGELLDNLLERNLDGERRYLFVIDGSKALRKAIRSRFGDRALVQRCQQHKRRNIMEHLPKELHRSAGKAMTEAYKSKSKGMAKKRLLQLAGQLQHGHPDAARSLKEGLDETLTVKCLGLPKALERFLSTTNPIENLNSTIRRVLRRVKHWRGGSMVRRWVAAGILEAEKGFRKVVGYRGLVGLRKALNTEMSEHIDVEERVA